MRIFFGGTLLAFLFVLQCVEVEAQPRSGMVTEPLDSAWVDGQRMFLTWRKGDPFAADATVVPRDDRYWRLDPVDRSKYGRPNLSGNNLVSGLDSALMKSLSLKEITALASLFHVEWERGVRKANYPEINPLSLNMLLTVDPAGRVVSVVFIYPDIPEYTRIPARRWKRLDREIRRGACFGADSSGYALTRFYFPYGIEWFADLRHSLRTGQPVDHYSRVGDAFAD